MTKLIFTIARKIKFILTQILPYDLSQLKSPLQTLMKYNLTKSKCRKLFLSYCLFQLHPIIKVIFISQIATNHGSKASGRK